MNLRNILFLILVLVQFSFAGDNIDSLEKVLKTQTGFNRLKTLDKLCRTYEAISPKSRLNYSNEYYLLALKSDIDSIIANANNAMSISYYYSSRIDSAIYFGERAIELYRKLKDSSRMASMETNLGVFYARTDNLSKALEKYYNALKIKRRFKDSVGIGLALNNISSIYYDFDEFEKAIETFKEVLGYYKSFPIDNRHATVYRNLGKSYFRLAAQQIKYGDSTKSIELDKNLAIEREYINIDNLSEKGKKYLKISEDNLMKSLDIFTKTNDEISIAKVKTDLAYIEISFGNLEKALGFLSESEDIFKKYEVILELSDAYNYFGYIYYLKGDFTKSKYYLEKSIEYAKVNNQSEIIVNSVGILSQVYFETKDYKNASLTQKLYIDLKDSLMNVSNRKEIEKIKTKYGLEQKESELNFMKENEKVLRQRMYLLFALILLLFLLIVGLYSRFSFKNKVNKELSQINKTLKQLNLDLMNSENELKEVNAAKDKLFSIIAHDLRNPLGAFRNVTEVLNKDFETLDADEMKEYIEAMNESASSLYMLLENLLTWSATQRGKISFHPSSENISQIVNLTLSPIIPVASSKNIDIINECDINISGILDKNLTSTIIRNLVSNAVKFSNAESKIVVYTKDVSDNQYQICVQDFGVGMSEEIKNTLFKIDKTQSHEGTSGEKGTGLGLIICKEFAEMQGGKIWVETEIGKGSTFCFTVNKS